jgi:hypothetical protein
MTKKGLSTIVFVMIIFMIILVILLIYQGLIANIMIGDTKDEMCKNEIRQRATSKSFGGAVTDIGGKKSYMPDCETEFVNLTAKDYSGGSGVNYELVKEALAQNLYRCQKLFNKGGPNEWYNPFTDWNVENVCQICSIVNFNGFDKDISNFGTYLMDHNTPDTKISYYEFAIGRKPTLEERDAATNAPPISTKDPYTTIFVFSKRNTWGEFFGWGGGGAAAGAGTGAVIILSFIPFVNVATWAAVGTIGGLALIAGTVGGTLASEHKDTYYVSSFMVPYNAYGLKDKCTHLGQKPVMDDLDNT